jgi:hypothetical protein
VDDGTRITVDANASTAHFLEERTIPLLEGEGFIPSGLGRRLLERNTDISQKLAAAG